MAGLHAVGGAEVVAARIDAQAPVLGICVGMQVLFERGVEHGVETDGLGVLSGVVDRLQAPVLPHMGWNTVRAHPDSVLFAGLDADARFYFVHSYAAAKCEGAATIAEYGSEFVAGVELGPLSATQFHPEKSGDAGAVLLKNWVNSLG
jgi:glutamine amidotransferase